MKESNIVISGIFLLCVFLCFIFSIVCFTKFNNSDHYYVASLGKNWGAGPISDVETGGFECPHGKFPIINDEWMGTQRGCYCTGLWTSLRRNSCGENDHHCADVFSINPVPFKKWKSTNLCGHRGPNYLSMKTVKSPNGCGSNYKNCGVVDTLGQYLCYPNNIACPYNFMKIMDKNFQVPTDKKYTVVPLGTNGIEGKAIFSNEYTDSKIINEFRVDDDQPCLSPEYKNLKHAPYLLERIYGHDKCTNAIGGEFIDNSFQKVDSIKYGYLYHDNGINSILESLPQFSAKYDYRQSDTSLWYKNYIGMNHACIEKMMHGQNEVEFIMGLVHIEDKINNMKIAAIVGIVFSCIGVFAIIVFGCIKLCQSEFAAGFANAAAGMVCVCLPALIIGSIIVGNINANNFDMTPLSEPGCTDSITTGALKGFSSNVSGAKSMAASYLSFGLIGLFAGVAVFLTAS